MLVPMNPVVAMVIAVGYVIHRVASVIQKGTDTLYTYDTNTYQHCTLSFLSTSGENK
jgi:hypothetical protein